MRRVETSRRHLVDLLRREPVLDQSVARAHWDAGGPLRHREDGRDPVDLGSFLEEPDDGRWPPAPEC